MKPVSLFLKGSLILIALFSLPYCTVNPVTGKQEISFVSEEQEIALGKEYDPQIVASFGLYENPTMQAFINEKGREMAKISHRPHLAYEFKVLDSPVVNAFAVPGGYVYFTRGIMAHFTNEAEFMGVLGHEIGHITARHYARQQTKQTLLQLGLVVGITVSKELRQFAEPLVQGLGVLFLKFSRNDERESDRLGVEYSTKVGYDAHEMADFFNTLNKMQVESGQRIPTWQSTHPNPANRYQDVNELSTKWQTDLNLANLSVNQDRYLQLLDGLVYGEDPRQGFVENDYFFHPELKFKFSVPRQWKTANSPLQFQMAPQNGKALMVLMAAKGSDLQEAADSFNQAQKLSIVSSHSTTVNNFPALRQLTEQKNPETGTTLRIRSYFIQYGGTIYAFHGLAVDKDFSQYEYTFNYTMTQFDALNDPSKLNRQPVRIKIVRANISGTLSEVLNYHNIPAERFKELAIMNGKELTEQVIGNTLIKILSE